MIQHLQQPGKFSALPLPARHIRDWRVWRLLNLICKAEM